MKTHDDSRSGNALFMILIAIFLLGGLIVLMSRGSGQSEDTGISEKDSIQASELLKYASGYANAVEALTTRGCSESQISFDDDDAAGVIGGYENANAPSDRRCHVFYAEGGGLRNAGMKTDWLDTAQSAATGYGLPYFTSSDVVIGVGVDGSPGADLVLLIPYLKKSVCAQILRRVGVNVVDIPQDIGPIDPSAYAAKKFTGTYVPTASIGDDTSLLNYGLIAKKKAFCVQSTGAYPVANTYHFYQVLIGR